MKVLGGQGACLGNRRVAILREYRVDNKRMERKFQDRIDRTSGPAHERVNAQAQTKVCETFHELRPRVKFVPAGRGGRGGEGGG